MNNADSRILGIIPARGGSKSIPRKNIKPFLNKPLLAWTAEAAVSSEIFDRIVLTTDDDEIARWGEDNGLEVPFLRPAELARDSTPTLPVVQHAVTWLKDNENYTADYVVLLEPTSPGRQGFHIKEAVNQLIKTGADSVVSVQEVPGHYSPHWQFNIGTDGRLALFTERTVSHIIPRRQELPVTYHRNGAIYVCKAELLVSESPSLYGEDVRAYVMDEKYSIDIDTPEDWERAERIMEKIVNG